MSQNELPLLYDYLLLSALVFGIGMIGFIARRNMIVMFLAAEMMLQGVALSLVAWSRFHGDLGGQVLVLFVIAVAACEAAVALALVVLLARRAGKLDILVWQRLREENLAPFVDEDEPQEPLSEPAWPHLASAGVAPQSDPQQDEHRDHV